MCCASQAILLHMGSACHYQEAHFEEEPPMLHQVNAKAPSGRTRYDHHHHHQSKPRFSTFIKHFSYFKALLHQPAPDLHSHPDIQLLRWKNKPNRQTVKLAKAPRLSVAGEALHSAPQAPWPKTSCSGPQSIASFGICETGRRKLPSQPQYRGLGSTSVTGTWVSLLTVMGLPLGGSLPVLLGYGLDLCDTDIHVHVQPVTLDRK